MIDIHSHILFARDDGSKTLEESLEMARQAVAGGTRVLFATPHVSNPQELARAVDIAPQMAELQAEFQRQEIALELVAGAEVDPLIGIEEALDAGAPILMGESGKYLLLDSAFSMLPRGLETIIYQLQLRHLTIILAHPERIIPIQENPQLLEVLVNRGVLLQVTGSSILGKNGPIAEEVACRLLELGWAHFIASDAHSPVTRRPNLADAALELLNIVDADTAADLLVNNGRRVIEGEAVPSNPQPYVTEKAKRSIFDIFRRNK